MILRLRKEKSPDITEAEAAVDREATDFTVEKTIRETNSTEAGNDLKKGAFYWAIHDKPMEELLLRNSNWFVRQTELESKAYERRVQYVLEQLNNIREQIDLEKKNLDRAESLEAELIDEKNELENSIEELNNQFMELIGDLGNTHKNLIQRRIEEVQEELSALTKMYNDVFESKFSNEGDLKVAIGKHRSLLDDLVEKSRDVLKISSEKLEKIYRFGSSRYSASFLISTGVLSAIAAGWFFAIFAEQNDLNNQNWLFFVLTNTFNYLSLYVEEYGQFRAAGYMLMPLFIMILGLTLLIFLCEFFLSKLTHDKSDIHLGVDLTRRKERFFKVNIKTNSLLSFWLQLLPWVFVLGVIMIIVAVGQVVGSDGDQIKTLGMHLSSQIIGTTIALLCTGLFFLYAVKVIEPRKEKVDVTPSTKRKTIFNGINKELVVFAIVVNTFLILIVVGQSAGLLSENKALLSIFCFVLLVNLTAFTLGYGIRQLGLFKTRDNAKRNLISLSNYRKALSSNKPIHTWIKEDRQFSRHYLAIQRELFALIQTKNKSLNQLDKDKMIQIFQSSDGASGGRWYRFWIPSKNKTSRRKINAFYRQNFPELSYQTEELRNTLNAKKRVLEDLNVKIAEAREGRSNFHLTAREEIRRLKRVYNYLAKQHIEMESDMVILHKQLEEECHLRERRLIEGYELGAWVKQVIMKKDGKQE